MVNGAKTFAPVKAASAAIAFYQKIYLFDHEPTQSPAVCIVRSSATRRFGLNTTNWKEPFEWGQVLDFAEAFGVRRSEYCHLVMAMMAVVMFGGMCRYDDASGLLWRNVRFVEDGSGFKISFDKCKNAQFRQGNKVLVASSPLAAVCPVRSLLKLRIFTGGRRTCMYSGGSTGGLWRKALRRPCRARIGSRMNYIYVYWDYGSAEFWRFRWMPSASSLRHNPAVAAAHPRH